MKKYFCLSLLILIAFKFSNFLTAQEVLPSTIPRVKEGSFPVSVQFTPVPSGKGWHDEIPPLTDQTIKETIHNIILHGCTNLAVGSFGDGWNNEKVINYAQQLGMGIDFTSNGVQLFRRNDPPFCSIYEPEYIDSVRKRIEPVLGSVKRLEKPYSIYPFMDEPFHADTTAFDYSAATAKEYQKRYGYPMPKNYQMAKSDPKKHLDFVNFQSSTFTDAWKQIYEEVKKFDPRPNVVMTHDSHNTMGGGVESDSKYAIDDVFHWGGEYADLFLYDIYPYTMFDYRYGELGKLPKPRISQMHYTIAQMRNLTTTYGKQFGFWLGTYNEGWFRRFMNSEMEKQYWGERELAYTAIANGANSIITGINIPQDTKHWDDFGKGMRTIQKVGPQILSAPKVKSQACFLFPRSQYVQINEEYFNVGLTFELFLRAFGELDIIHEEQIVDETMNGYKILILADVKMLPTNVAKNIEKFVQNGGIVIADCVPQMNAYFEPMETMKDLFGVSNASTDRVLQKGQWIPFSILPPKWGFNMEITSEPDKTFDKAVGNAYETNYNIDIVSPRNIKITDGTLISKMENDEPFLVEKVVGKGKVYLFGFCIQDTYFHTYKTNDELSRTSLYNLIHKVMADTNVQSHCYSSNPDMEVAIRKKDEDDEVYVFIINHESPNAITEVTLAGLGFEVDTIMDVEWGRTVDFTKNGDIVKFTIMAVEGTPTGVTRLLKVTPKE